MFSELKVLEELNNKHLSQKSNEERKMLEDFEPWLDEDIEL